MKVILIIVVLLAIVFKILLMSIEEIKEIGWSADQLNLVAFFVLYEKVGGIGDKRTIRSISKLIGKSRNETFKMVARMSGKKNLPILPDFNLNYLQKIGYEEADKIVSKSIENLINSKYPK